MDNKLSLRRVDRVLKRFFDLTASLIGSVLTLPIVLVAWLAATADTRANGFFIQERVGRNGRIFRLIKLRTMKSSSGPPTTITTADDPRITKLGRWLRRTKIDELPQLWNVALGHMSFVGPRPDVPGFADNLVEDDRVILSVRPGITGPATIKYRNEEHLLAEAANPEAYNREVIFPDKVRINKEYIRGYSFGRDVKIIWLTVHPVRRRCRERSPRFR